MIWLECSGCKRRLFIDRIHYRRVGPSHVQIGVNFYLFNSAFKASEKRQFGSKDTFECFCSDCYNKSVYCKRFKEVHDDGYKSSKLSLNIVNQFKIDVQQKVNLLGARRKNLRLNSKMVGITIYNVKKVETTNQPYSPKYPFSQKNEQNKSESRPSLVLPSPTTRLSSNFPLKNSLLSV